MALVKEEQMGELVPQQPAVPAAEQAPEAPLAKPQENLETEDRRLASERVIINAPMSFAGAAQRAWRIGEHLPTTPRWVVIALVITPVTLLWWCAVACWYLTFGLFLVPYRFLRRGARKRKAEAIRHREMLDAVEQHPRT
jgi:hypothetical protein